MKGLIAMMLIVHCRTTLAGVFPPISWYFEVPSGGVWLPISAPTPAPSMEHSPIWFWLFIGIIIVAGAAAVLLKFWKRHWARQRLPIMGRRGRAPIIGGEVNLTTYESVL